MLKDGLLTSTPGPGDGRQRLTRLTDAGRAMLPQLQQYWQATALAAASLDADLEAPLSQVLGAAIAALEKNRLRSASPRRATSRLRPDIAAEKGRWHGLAEQIAGGSNKIAQNATAGPPYHFLQGIKAVLLASLPFLASVL